MWSAGAQASAAGPSISSETTLCTKTIPVPGRWRAGQRPRENPGEPRARSSYSWVSACRRAGQARSQPLSQHTRQHLLWYMEKERNWFLNIWYMSPSGLWRNSAGWGT